MSAHLTNPFEDTQSKIKQLKDDIKTGLLAAFTIYYINERHKMVESRGRALQAFLTGITLPNNTGSLFSKPRCDFSATTTWSGNGRPDDLENLFLNYESLILACDNESGGLGKSSFAKLIQKTVGHLIPPKGPHRDIWISAEKSCMAARVLAQQNAETTRRDGDKDGSDDEWEETTTTHGLPPTMPPGGFQPSYGAPPVGYSPAAYGAPHPGYGYPAGTGVYGGPPPPFGYSLPFQQQQPAPWGASPLNSSTTVTRRIVRSGSSRSLG